MKSSPKPIRALKDIDEARAAMKKAIGSVEEALVERDVDDYLRPRTINIITTAPIWGDLPASPEFILEGALAEALNEADPSRRCNRPH